MMKRIVIDIKTGQVKGSIDIVENDNKSDIYKIYILKNKAIYDLTGKTPRVVMIDKKQNIKQVIDLNITDAKRGEVSLQVSDAWSRKDGRYICQLAIFGLEGFLEQSTYFWVTIKNSLFNDIGEEILADPQFEMLKQELEKFQAAFSKIDEWDKYFEDTSGKIEEKYTERLNKNDSKINDIEGKTLINAKAINDVEIKTSINAGKINALETTKATKEEVEVERKRIDLLTKTEEGQTEGNSELLDIRIGADGVSYDTAGEAVREQFNKVNVVLEVSKENILKINNKADIKRGKNLFDKNNVTKNNYVRWDSGILAANSDYSASEYIVIESDMTYTINWFDQIAFYDIDKKYISGVEGYQLGNKTITAPENATFIRTSVRNNKINEYQLEKGENATTYEPYNIKLEEDLTTKIIEEAKEITLREVIKDGKNLFNKAKVIEGYYVQWSTGVLNKNTEYSTSDYIEIKPSTDYTINFYDQVAYYDASKEYISGTEGYQLGIKTITTPENAVFIRASIRNSKINEYQLEEGSVYTGFVPYHKVLIDSLKKDVIDSIVKHEYKSIRKCFEKLTKSYFGEKVTIKLIGDSITAGVGGSDYGMTGEVIYGDFKVNENGHCWANSLKKYLENKLNCEVLNFGTSGRNSKEILTNINSIVRENDDIIVCMIGTNNRHTTTQKELFENLIDIHKTITEMGKEVILMSNIPASVENETDGQRGFHMEDVDIAVSLAASYLNIEYISVYKLFIEYCKTRNITIDSLLADGLHPNDEGYNVMFYLICNALGFGVKREGATW